MIKRGIFYFVRGWGQLPVWARWLVVVEAVVAMGVVVGGVVVVMI